jgi:Raf kinase inhibitor-like YbhB/YbcL family protein
MQLTSNSISDGQVIAAEFAFCRPDPDSHVTLAENKSPHLAWSGAPEGTKSFVLLCCDPDVPSKPDDVNQEGRTVPADLPRVDFYHWVLVDIPASVTELQVGADASGVTPKGKEQTPDLAGAKRGVNGYTGWFAGDPDMGGDYFGYDGPCPPWNDSIPHHYVFTVYALDIESCPVAGPFTGSDVLEEIEGHVLDKASITGLYSLNPDVSV